MNHVQDVEIRQEQEIEGQETPVSKQEELFPVPPRGEMIAGLIQLTEIMLSGEIAPEEALQTLHIMEEKMEQVFDNMMAEMVQIPQSLEEYGQTVQDSLEDIRFLFHAGLQQMVSFYQDEDPSRIRIGKMLTSMGEDKYRELLSQLNRDATGSSFGGMEDVPTILAQELKLGRITKGQFQDELMDLEGNLLENVYLAKEIITVGLKKASLYDGMNDKVMLEALESFQKAQELLSEAILSLHTTEEIEKAALLKKNGQ